MTDTQRESKTIADLERASQESRDQLMQSKEARFLIDSDAAALRDKEAAQNN